MAGPGYESLLRRRRIWGVPPDAVEEMASECEQERAELQTRIREMEIRLANVTAQRDEANQTVATLQARVTELENDQKEQPEVVSRPELVREEALRFVVDAWAEAQTIREQTREEIEKAEAAAREEVAAIRASLVGERERHDAEMQEARARSEAEMREAQERYEAEIVMLRERRLKAIADLESLAENLLSQAARGHAPKPPDAALDIVPEVVPPVAEAPPPVVAVPPVAPPALVSPAPERAQPDEPASPPAPQPAAHTVMEKNGDTSEDEMLAKALDDLEAVLSVSRKQNGSG